jgi:hypothetical protein
VAGPKLQANTFFPQICGMPVPKKNAKNSAKIEIKIDIQVNLVIQKPQFGT